MCGVEIYSSFRGSEATASEASFGAVGLSSANVSGVTGMREYPL